MGLGDGSGFLGGFQALIKSIQRGTITCVGGATSATATISSVVTANSSIRCLGMTQTMVSTDWGVGLGRLSLTNATTVTANVSSGSSGDAVLSYEVPEYNANFVKSVQRGTITWSTAGAATATITSVDTTKTELTNSGYHVTTGPPGTDAGATKIVLTNATTVTANKIAAGITSNVNYEAREFNP